MKSVKIWNALFFLSRSVDAIHRADGSKYFLFIEPDASSKAETPLDDELTRSLEAAFANSVSGTSDYTNLRSTGKFTPGTGYRGFHFVEDGETSTVYDYLLPNGLITNSCCLHYARYYRHKMPTTEIQKLRLLHEHMQDSARKSDLSDL